MIDSFTKSFEYLTDKSVKWTTKMMNFIVFFIIIVFLNNSLKFVSSYRLNNKLEQLQKIHSILSDSLVSKDEKIFLTEERQNIIHQTTFLEIICNYYSSLSYSDFLNIFKRQKTAPVTKPANKNSPNISEKPIRNFYWHFIFSNIGLILLSLVVPYAVYKDPKNDSISLMIFTTLVVWVFFLIIGLIFAFLFGLIPVFEKVWINYVLDLILHLSVIGFSAYLIDKKTSKT